MTPVSVPQGRCATPCRPSLGVYSCHYSCIDMAEIDDVLNAEERILWEGSPAPIPFFASTALSALIGLLILAALLRTLTTIPPSTSTVAAILFFLPFFLLAIALAAAFPLYRILAFLCIRYAITSKRILLQRGVLFRELAMVDFDQITQAAVERNLVDLLLGFGHTASLQLTTRTQDDEPQVRSATYVFSHIAHPDTVFAFFHRAESDVKTDMQYPNQLRPRENDGYATIYLPRADGVASSPATLHVP